MKKIHEITDHLKSPISNVQKERLNSNNQNINNFYNRMTNTPYYNDTLYKNNVKNLKIRANTFDFLFGYRGLYNGLKNRLVTNGNPHTTSHELMHVSSSYKLVKNKTIVNYSGFGRIVIDKKNRTFNKYNHALTEGYTELLNIRYFGMPEDEDVSYILLVNIAYLLEILIGRKNMEEAYFTADLELIYKKLSKVDTKENIDNLLLTMDKILEVNNESLESIIIKNNIIENTNFILKKLYSYCLIKYKDNPQKYNEFMEALHNMSAQKIIEQIYNYKKSSHSHQNNNGNTTIP